MGNAEHIWSFERRQMIRYIGLEDVIALFAWHTDLSGSLTYQQSTLQMDKQGGVGNFIYSAFNENKVRESNDTPESSIAVDQ